MLYVSLLMLIFSSSFYSSSTAASVSAKKEVAKRTVEGIVGKRVISSVPGFNSIFPVSVAGTVKQVIQSDNGWYLELIDLAAEIGIDPTPEKNIVVPLNSIYAYASEKGLAPLSQDNPIIGDEILFYYPHPVKRSPAEDYLEATISSILSDGFVMVDVKAETTKNGKRTVLKNPYSIFVNSSDLKHYSKSGKIFKGTISSLYSQEGWVELVVDTEVMPRFRKEIALETPYLALARSSQIHSLAEVHRLLSDDKKNLVEFLKHFSR